MNNNAVSFKTIKNINKRLHIEKAKGDIRQNYKYCSKDGKFITNIKLKLTEEERLEEIIESEYNNIIWKDWQEEILKIIDGKVSNRKIFWYWEATGNIGKSYLLKYIALKMNKRVIIGNGKMNDVFNQINNHIQNGNNPEIILIDVPRDYAETYFNYGDWRISRMVFSFQANMKEANAYLRYLT